MSNAWSRSIVACTLLLGPTGPGVCAAQRQPVASVGTAAPSTPRRVSAPALQELADRLRRYVAADRLVGAELLVIEKRQVVLHEAFGWRDRESGTPMARDTLFNIRSMTKALTGVAVQVLIDEGRLAETDRVARFIPEFRQGPGTAITVEQLLSHRSGLPLSIVTDFDRFPSLQAVAERAAAVEPAFAPGSGFLYSDTGSDLLGLIVERAAGRPLEQVIAERVLGPLGMSETFAFLRPGDGRAGRICSAYLGGTGAWSRYWSAERGPLYKYQMGSQSLYSTPRDYARFLAMLLDGGSVNGRRFLSARAVRRTTQPVADTGFEHGFTGLRARYGQMLQLLVPEGEPGAAPAAFGHGGSDGTLAWAWPGRHLMVLLFTQSRAHTAGVRFEHDVDHLLLHPTGEASVPPNLRPFIGTYVDSFGVVGLEDDEVMVIGGRLMVDIPSQGTLALELPDANGRLRVAGQPAIWLTFEGDTGSGSERMVWHENGQDLVLPRVGTPAADRVAERVRAARGRWLRYVGRYRAEQPDTFVEVVARGTGLAVIPAGQTSPLPLAVPDGQGRWRFRSNPALCITFQENEQGEVISLTALLPDGRTLVRPRLPER